MGPNHCDATSLDDSFLPFLPFCVCSYCERAIIALQHQPKQTPAASKRLSCKHQLVWLGRIPSRPYYRREEERNVVSWVIRQRFLSLPWEGGKTSWTQSFSRAHHQLLGLSFGGILENRLPTYTSASEQHSRQQSRAGTLENTQCRVVFAQSVRVPSGRARNGPRHAAKKRRETRKDPILSACPSDYPLRPASHASGVQEIHLSLSHRGFVCVCLGLRSTQSGFHLPPPRPQTPRLEGRL